MLYFLPNVLLHGHCLKFNPIMPQICPNFFFLIIDFLNKINQFLTIIILKHD